VSTYYPQELVAS